MTCEALKRSKCLLNRVGTELSPPKKTCIPIDLYKFLYVSISREKKCILLCVVGGE